MPLERPVPPGPYDVLPPVPSFALESDDVADGQPLASQFIHGDLGGGNVSPQLRWSGAPAATRSYLVTCFDPMPQPARASGTGCSATCRRR